MKKTLYFFAAMTMAASSAMASKARVSALSSSPAVTDIQSIFNNPADMHYVSDFVTFEFGEQSGTPGTAVDGTPNAEGGFINTMGDAKFGIYLGKMATEANGFRATAAASGVTLLQQENPIEVFYGSKAGDLNWGASFSFSNSEKKLTAGSADDQKQSTMGIRMGVKTDDWAAWANVGLGNEASQGEAKLKGTAGVILGGHYIVDNMKYYGRFDQGGAKLTNAAGTDVFDRGISTTTIGFTNSWKNDGNLAFYGLAYQMANDSEKIADKKTVTSAMPFTLGAEVLAASWLKLRGSISQNLLMGNNKVTDAATATNERNDSIAHNTTTAAGAGFVWGHNALDVVMQMGTNSTFDAATFGTNASYTYTF